MPLVYDPKIKRVRLLEDVNESQSPFTKYNFGNSPDLLFRPQNMDPDEFREIISDVSSSRYGAPTEDRERSMSDYDPIIRLRSYDPIIRLQPR